MSLPLDFKENLYRTCLCVRRTDGSREILLYDLSYQDFDFSRCYLDQDGSCYCWINSYIEQSPDQPNDPVNTTLTKYRPTGKLSLSKNGMITNTYPIFVSCRTELFIALLNLFLSGSETLLGMVDWENGNCNFRSELFQKLLEAAKRFGDDGKSLQESYPAEEIDYSNIFFFDSQTDLEKSGMVQTGTLFDDGCYPAIYSSETLAVNANSSVKEGAWEFISFLLLNQENPSALEDSLFPPIRKDAFDLWIAQQRTKVSDGKTWSLSINMIERDGSLTTIQNQYTEDDIRDEKVKEYKKALEEARPCPLRTDPVLNIILKESEFYFNGSKTAEEVSAVIHNRVQLYLEENR